MRLGRGVGIGIGICESVDLDVRYGIAGAKRLQILGGGVRGWMPFADGT